MNGDLLRRRAFAFLCIIASAFLLTCVTDSPPQVKEPPRPPLVLTFAGDIMAHTVNFMMDDYRRIYEDLRSVLTADDLSFGNLETPVADSLPMSTFPSFNVHSAYLRAAVDGGFDVFSLANNHANDHGIVGIRGTLAAVSSPELAGFGIATSGLRAVKDEPMRPVLIERNGWRVLFLAVTEILNSPDRSRLVYYLPPRADAREAFLTDLARMRAEYQPDLFVLSVHANEPEYVRAVSEAKRKWFREIATAGVDVVWGHHPHVMQGWETVSFPLVGGDRVALLMYSMGNFVSGQRYTPNRDNPSGPREYTGDAVLLQATVASPGAGVGALRAIPITSHSVKGRGVVVRRFDDSFVSGLAPAWERYYRARYESMRSYLPLLPELSVPAILKE